MPPEDGDTSTEGREDQSGGTGSGTDTEGLKRALAAERRRAKEAEAKAKAAEEEAEDLRKRSMSDQDKALEEARREGERAARERHKGLEAENLKLRVALELGLPMPLVNRLQGDTEDDIRADAAELTELMGLKPGGGETERKSEGEAKPDGEGGKPGRLDTGGGRREGAPAKGSITEARERYKVQREEKAATQKDPFAGWGPRVGGNFSNQ
jgi:hypothetical protein